MPIAISDDHRELAGVARSFLEGVDARAAARAQLDAPDESLPTFWKELADLGSERDDLWHRQKRSTPQHDEHGCDHRKIYEPLMLTQVFQHSVRVERSPSRRPRLLGECSSASLRPSRGRRCHGPTGGPGRGPSSHRLPTRLAGLADGGKPVDRTGAALVVEVYPAAALRVWGPANRPYKGSGNRVAHV